MTTAMLADRNGRMSGGPLDDGLLDNWLLLARQIVAVAGADYVAATYPDCAESYIASWMHGVLSLETRKARLEAERQWLSEFWNDGGGEFAEWVGYAGYPRALSEVVAAHLPVESPHESNKRLRTAQERIHNAFRDHAEHLYAPRREANLKSELLSSVHEKRCIGFNGRPCGREIGDDAVRCRSCAARETRARKRLAHTDDNQRPGSSR